MISLVTVVLLFSIFDSFSFRSTHADGPATCLGGFFRPSTCCAATSPFCDSVDPFGRTIATPSGAPRRVGAVAESTTLGHTRIFEHVLQEPAENTVVAPVAFAAGTGQQRCAIVADRVFRRRLYHTTVLPNQRACTKHSRF